MLIDKIKELAATVHRDVVTTRRYLHQHPELSFQEYNTCSYVARKLDEMGIAWEKIGNTGVVAVLKGALPSEKVIALRADMDALPITEISRHPYVSLEKGIMHACGHDAHTASLLGTMDILQQLRASFAGTIKFIFQPGEEELPGGASLLIKEGVLSKPAPSSIIGQHVMPSLPVGKIGIRSGRFMASKDDLVITVHGRGGHGAQPNQNIDPVLIAAHIIIALQQIVSRHANPSVGSVLSFGKLQALGTTNIIPDEVLIEGTFRTLEENWRQQALTLIKQMAEHIAIGMGGNARIEVRKGYPVLFNDPALSGTIREFATSYIGTENIVDLDVWMASEDFAYYATEIPGSFYMLGVGNKDKGISASLHSPDFDIDEDALLHSTGLMAYLALSILGN